MLLEELFHEEAHRGNVGSGSRKQNVSPLPLPEVDKGFEASFDNPNGSGERSLGTIPAAATGVIWHQRLAVLVLETASKSLVESDFRRIAPEGKQIDHWTGPGDTLKVAWNVARSLETLLLIIYMY